MATHGLRIAPGELWQLSSGWKHFLVTRDTTPPLHYRDEVLLSSLDLDQPTLRRYVRHAEEGPGYAPGYVGIEFTEEPL